MPTEYI
jgi:hypothetical protein